MARRSKALQLTANPVRGMSAALSMRFQAIMEDIMTIRIQHRDKTSISIQRADVSLATTNAIPVSQASYSVHEAVFGELCGSSWTMVGH